MSVGSTKSTATPNRGNSSANNLVVAVYNDEPATAWSPGFKVPNNTVLTAAMPVAKARHFSPPSKSAMTRSQTSMVGLP